MKFIFNLVIKFRIGNFLIITSIYPSSILVANSIFVKKYRHIFFTYNLGILIAWRIFRITWSCFI